MGSIILIVIVYYVFGFDKLFALFKADEAEDGKSENSTSAFEKMKEALSNTMGSVEDYFKRQTETTTATTESTTNPTTGPTTGLPVAVPRLTMD